MELKSGWVGYIDRTHEQIMASIKSRMPLKCPEITDLTDSNPMMKLASIYAGIAEMLNYYIDSNAEEVYLSTANFYESGMKIAAMLGYKPQLARPATGLVTFSVTKAPSEDKLIPSGTVLIYNNLRYITVDKAVLQKGQYSVSVNAKNISQFEARQNVSLTGEKDERIILENDQICEGTVKVLVNDVEWTDTYDFSDADNSTKCFKASVNVDRNAYVQFGDGTNGKIPVSGDKAEILYRTTDGLSGNTGSGIQLQIESNLGIFGLSAYSKNGFSGGYGYETLESLRKNVPRVYRARLRAITLQDFKDLIDEHTSVAQSAVEYEGNLKLKGYIVPTGGGIASSELISEISKYMSDKIPFLTTIEFKSAGNLGVSMAIDFSTKTGYSKTSVTDRLKANILNMFRPENQKIRANLYLSDIYEVIENTEGVSHSILKEFYINPDVRSIGSVLSEFKGIIYLNKTGNTHKWEIIMYSSSEYQLLRDDKYVGDYAVGETVSLDEMEITVQDNGYEQGTYFEFYTYKDLISTNNVQIEEFSILTLDSKNLIIG